MAHQFDAVNKFMLDQFPADWLKLAGFPTGDAVRVIDADLSISRRADRLVRVDGPDPYVAHAEFQSGADSGLDLRMLVY